ncbi:MAG: hypothetical protein SVV80_09660 [Planctomycetota bacterium]|nr:hypothetical protein [Planctomycetota bacterium]
MSNANSQSGFTLAELVVATMLTVLVTGSTVAILRSTTATRRLVNRQMSLQQETRLAVNTVATSLRNAYRSTGDQATLEGTDGWLGEMPADRVRFFTISRGTVRQDQPESDVKECEFFLHEPTDQAMPSLMQRLDPTRNKQPDGGGVVQCVAENILGLDLAYHDGRQWLDEWPEGTKGWPVAIRIRLAVTEAPSTNRHVGGHSSQVGTRNVWTTSRVVNFPHRPVQNEQDSTQDKQDKE